MSKLDPDTREEYKKIDKDIDEKIEKLAKGKARSEYIIICFKFAVFVCFEALGIENTLSLFFIYCLFETFKLCNSI
jgi:hypothetical protein